ncbi:MAG: hypothetical protein HC836_31325 [Richelia sp. RM2_1_2]|nr:hypothetical protein [Richelia sp. SM1_7_0]NJN11776.1 hypothetical protein [Richelia sp. RM1_1_1]NJO29376.1 hypothetical protein [Richelia sp. SL_2_1]NJO62559.1 hypothetical protein [Richelia sp. RM2_1_2]
MSEDKAKNQAEKNHPKEEAPELSPELLDKIKHPPSIDSTIRNQSPEELKHNPAVSPEMLDD